MPFFTRKLWRDKNLYLRRLRPTARQTELYKFPRSGITRTTRIAPTLRYRGDKAMEFWEGMARDDALRREDPRKRLLIWLQENKEKPSMTVRAFSVAWRAYVQNEDIQLLRPTRGSTPLKILDVPLEKITKPQTVDQGKLDAWRQRQRQQQRKTRAAEAA
jgi:hypothetical protein